MSRAEIIVVAALAIGWTLGDKSFWETKPYNSWSKKECEGLLRVSPWTECFAIGEYGINTSRFGTDGGLGTATQSDPRILAGGERTVEVKLFFSILSARPIRMALTRLDALEHPGAMDVAVANRLAEAPIPDVILVRIDYTVEPKGHHAIRDFELFFQQASLGFFSNSTYLASERSRVPIVRYLRPGPQSPRPVFVFPRMNDHGQAFFADRKGSLYLETQLDLRKFGGQMNYEIHLKFNLSKMVLAGELEL